MKKIIAVIVMFSLECTSFGQLPTDTSQQRKGMQRDKTQKDTTKLKGGAIIDTIRPIDTLNRKIELMRPKTKDDLKDTVPQHKQ